MRNKPYEVNQIKTPIGEDELDDPYVLEITGTASTDSTGYSYISGVETHLFEPKYLMDIMNIKEARAIKKLQDNTQLIKEF